MSLGRRGRLFAVAGGAAALVAVAEVVLVLALRPSTDDPEAAIRGYLEALRDGDLDKAYGHLCPHTRMRTTSSSGPT